MITDFGIFKRDIDISQFAVPLTRDSRDIQEVYRVESTELNILWELMLWIFKEEYIYTASDYGLDAWEKILDITPINLKDVQGRRNEILSVLIGQRHFTMPKVQEMLDFKYGKDVVTHSVNCNAYEYWLDFKPNSEYLLFNVLNFIEPIIPKNLLIKVKSTTKLSQSVYIGGVVDVKETIRIDAKVNIDGLSTSNNTYIGGVVDTKEIIRI